MLNYTLRPSGAALWSNCSAYPSMTAGYAHADQEQDNDVREQGIAAHHLALTTWQGYSVPAGTFAPNGVEIDDEMIEGIDEYLTVVRSWRGDHAQLETPVDCSRIFPGLKGTVDAWDFDVTKSRLYVADLKYGYKFVEVWENPQLVIYAVGLLDMLGIVNDQDVTIEFSIVQPRSYHREGTIRTWCVRASDLRALVNWLADRAYAAQSPDARAIAGPWCYNCAARHACMALRGAALRELEVTHAAIPHELTPYQVGQLLHRMMAGNKLMEALITGLSQQAESLLRDGEIVPYFEMGQGQARRSWNSPEAEKAAMTIARISGVDISKPTRALTPRQAEQLLSPDIVSMYSHRPNTAVKLLPLDPNKTRKAFSRKTGD